MRDNKFIKKTAWDKKIFRINTYEISPATEKAFKQMPKLKGHFTLKVDPGSPKRIIHEYGFYYCDTLIEPYCGREDFKFIYNNKVGLTRGAGIGELLKISHGAFYGRFHRDFNILKGLADARYDAWLTQLWRKKRVFGLCYCGRLIGFFAFSGNKILLHALKKEYRGRGLAKYLWSAACRELFKKGYREIYSSISTSNLPVLNLYVSLGFKFRNVQDIYHRLIR